MVAHLNRAERQCADGGRAGHFGGMKAGEGEALVHVKPLGMGVGNVGIQYHQLALLCRCFFLQPGDQLFADAPAAMLGVDDEIIDVELAPAPKARAYPESAAADEFVVQEYADGAVALAKHLGQKAVEFFLTHPGVLKRYQGVNSRDLRR